MREVTKKIFPGAEKRRWKAVCALALAVIAAVAAYASGPNKYLEQKRTFREEVKNKVEKELDRDGRYFSVIFRGEEGEYRFGVTPDDRKRLKAHAREYFSCDDRALLEKIVDELDSGHYVLCKQYSDDGFNTRVIFLSPKADYWDWLVDPNGIEKMFHAFNFSVGLYAPDAVHRYAVIQTEGSFFGITQAVNQPLFCWNDPEERFYTCDVPPQAEMIASMEKMRPLIPGRERPEEKFIDACRTHPCFREKDDNGGYVVKDEELLEIYDEVIASMDEKCAVKESLSSWRVHEDYPYLVADYSLKTTVNIDAVVPRPLRFLEGIVQIMLNEVSVKYIPLSMKNFRDYAVECREKEDPGSPDSREP